MADPAMAAARAVDQLTDEALPGLPMTDVDRVEDDLLAELSILSIKPQLQALIAQGERQVKTIEALAFHVWSGTQRCLYDRYEEGWLCERCREARQLLTALGFDGRMREWAGA